MDDVWNKLIFLLQLIKLLFKFKCLLNFLIKSINHPIFIVLNSSLNSTACLITTSRICKVKPKVVFVSRLINIKQYKKRSLMNNVCYDSCLETHNIEHCASNESIFSLHHQKCQRKALEKKNGWTFPAQSHSQNSH